MNNRINLIQRFGSVRGTIYYTDYARMDVIKSREGWFHRDLNNWDLIITRRIGGRNFHGFVEVNRVVDFVPYVKPAKVGA
jgi:hypothetical protein